MATKKITLGHAPCKMRRNVKETVPVSNGLESRYECLTCHKKIWKRLQVLQPAGFVCDGRSVATVFPIVTKEPFPTAQEVLSLLRDISRHLMASRLLTSHLGQRIGLMISRLESMKT